VIDNFVMSCRVMGRDIEHAIIKKLLNLASAAGNDTVVGRFVASEKNMPVSKLYLNNNFTQGDDELWVFNLNQQPVPEESQLMRLHWNVQELLE
jgi:predicted enzyme involved in methoxymalonyl-ACP biosynthesis